MTKFEKWFIYARNPSMIRFFAVGYKPYPRSISEDGSIITSTNPIGGYCFDTEAEAV